MKNVGWWVCGMTFGLVMLTGCTPQETVIEADESIEESEIIAEEEEVTPEDMMAQVMEMMVGEEPDDEIDRMSLKSDDIEAMRGREYMWAGILEDVSDSGASGEAQAMFTNEEYSLWVTFEDLVRPEEDFFYEGWLVRPEPFHLISTGTIGRNSSGAYEDLFMSSDDLTDHLIYVLTLEPDDDDPAPAEHVLEGMMKLVNDTDTMNGEESDEDETDSVEADEEEVDIADEAEEDSDE